MKKREITVEMVVDDLQKFNQQISEYEKQYNAKFIEAFVKDGKAHVRFLYPVGRIDGEEVGVNVWNCQAQLFIGKKTEGNLDLTSEQKEALEKWKEYVIYTENGGAINWSGVYLPSPFAIEILKRILVGDLDALNEISEPTTEDFKQTAEVILQSLEGGLR